MSWGCVEISGKMYQAGGRVGNLSSLGNLTPEQFREQHIGKPEISNFACPGFGEAHKTEITNFAMAQSLGARSGRVCHRGKNRSGGLFGEMWPLWAFFNVGHHLS